MQVLSSVCQSEGFTPNGDILFPGGVGDWGWVWDWRFLLRRAPCVVNSFFSSKNISFSALVKAVLVVFRKLTAFSYEIEGSERELTLATFRTLLSSVDEYSMSLSLMILPLVL